MNKIYQNLLARKLIYQSTAPETVEKLIDSEKVTFYTGFDPTGGSLHVGHLLPIMVIRRLQKAGHKPVILLGGATAQIGDPSGKQKMRPEISSEQLEKNCRKIKKQLLNFISEKNAVFLDNSEWFSEMKFLNFMKKVGRRFSINKMLTAESVKQRLETGISYLEFSYMLLQAYDFYYLNKNYNCSLQLGGQDQWGNIVAGIDLTRKLSQNEVFGLTFPLLMDSQGDKFGKTAGGAVWLDSNKTSVFDYYQFWRNCDDTDVERLLKFFTDIDIDEIKQLANFEAPKINRPKEILAFEATKVVHGKKAAEDAYIAAGTKFGFADPLNKISTSSNITEISLNEKKDTKLPSYEINKNEFSGKGVWICKLFSDAGLTNSNGEARRLIQSGGAYLNDERVKDFKLNVTLEDFTDNQAIIKSGKKHIKRIVLT